MIKDLSGDENTLTNWIGAVDADLPPLRAFTSGLRRDLDAVVAGLTLPYNSGAVKGTVNRIKQLKTAMYGRAQPDPLHKPDTARPTAALKASSYPHHRRRSSGRVPLERHRCWSVRPPHRGVPGLKDRSS
jgi:hypothetical protein